MGPHFRDKIAIRSGDNSHVDGFFIFARLERAILYKLRKTDLKCRRQVIDISQKESATFRCAESLRYALRSDLQRIQNPSRTFSFPTLLR